jgi:uncharacterized protein YbaR (Trm112 family)
LLHLQNWSPFGLDPVEFAPLNFDFHPSAVRGWLRELDFHVEKTLAVSHFRVGVLKRTIPASVLAGLDSIFQWTGAVWQYTPSVFIRSRAEGGKTGSIPADPKAFFKCPECGQAPLTGTEQLIICPACKREWNISEGIYDFRGK